ncbi:MAG: 16S rRNA (cytosine(1402)-N(4))-methyltransferase, partial [Verrucomicrobiales bacterium]|nr:16S rRNA (cytosine(1402)-N(4))-methyltransferase [Verrucomicrobiales bacterium]
KVFQALRVYINDEIGALREFLEAAPRWLKPGGRLLIITFQSQEDRCVKHAFQHFAAPTFDRPEWPSPKANPDHLLRILTRKPIEPSEEEIKRNPRARSAKLRVAERLPVHASS